jgi:hypothetical protein
VAKFQPGDNPADHSVRETVDYLSGDVSPEERDRVMQAEREGKNRVGVMSGSGVEATTDAVTDPAGPNEAATGQVSPADRAKTVDDPQASGDAGETAEKYGEDAPASLGPDMPQSPAEQDAHDATAATLEAAQYGRARYDDEGNEIGRTYTPEEALKAASAMSGALRNDRNRR